MILTLPQVLFLGPTLVLIISLCSAQLSAQETTKVPLLLSNGETKKITCELNEKRRWQLRSTKNNSSRSGQNGSFKKTANQACRTLVPPKTVGGISDLPSLSEIVNVSSLKNQSVGNNEVSGEPPFLPTFPNQDLKSLFWRDGVIERLAAGTPTPDDCNEFFGGNSDGHSAGLAGCFLTQSTGRILEELLRSSVSFCYLKEIPLLGLGAGIEVVSGQENIPGGNVERIFESPPGKTDFLVELRIKGFSQPEEDTDSSSNAEEIVSKIFVNPTSKSTLKKRSKQYGYDIFFCEGEQSTFEQHENASVGVDGKVSIEIRGLSSDGFLYNHDVRGYLATQRTGEEKNLVFNPNLPRTASTRVVNEDFGINDLGEVVVNADNTILAKNRSAEQEGASRLSYAVMEIAGSGVQDLQFLQGAYKDEKEGRPGEGFSVEVEFREDQYLSSPGGNFSEKLREVDIGRDPFYSSADSPEFDPGLFDCSAVADVVIELDFSEPRLQEIANRCESDGLSDMNYCLSDEDIVRAQENFFDVCFQGP